MKYCLLLILILPCICHGQDDLQSFRLVGRMKDFPDSAKASGFYLMYTQNGTAVKDSAEVVNGRFVFRGKLSEPVEADLMAVAAVPGTKLAEEYTYLVYSIYLEPGNQKVIARKFLHTKAFTAKGSRTNAQYIQLYRDLARFENRVQPLYEKMLAARRAGDQPDELRWQRSSDSIYSLMREELYLPFIQQNPSSPVALYAFQRYTRRSSDPARDELLFAGLSDNVKQLARGRQIAKKLEAAIPTGIGKQAIDFTQNDTTGNPVRLSDYQGNYVLLDFWASWCVPCRLENPGLVRANEKYNDRNFRIISISLDREQDRSLWLKAIRDDKLQWTHLSDLKYWQNEVAKLYRIESVPQNLLIDPQGKIIAKNLYGAQLENELKKVFAEKKAF